jgi:hypothetical protein
VVLLAGSYYWSSRFFDIYSSTTQQPKTAGAKHTMDGWSKPELDGKGLTGQSMHNADGNMVVTTGQIHELDGAP